MKIGSDKRASQKVNRLVRGGHLPRADSFQCVDCGEQARDYDHHLGYAPEHWLDVQPVCRSCHKHRHVVREEPETITVPCPHGKLAIRLCRECRWKQQADYARRRRKQLSASRRGAAQKSNPGNVQALTTLVVDGGVSSGSRWSFVLVARQIKSPLLTYDEAD